MRFEDRYGTLDRILHRIAFKADLAQRAVADVEEMLYADTLGSIPLEDPVFITALPRSGTTILLKLLHDSGHFATHIYRDMPFILCPLLWSRFSSQFAVEDRPKERAHGDGLQVSPDSPEAFEEMIWKHFWPDHYRSDRIRPWRSSDENPEFETFLESHVRKVVALRRDGSSDTRRYASKNNANISRLAEPPRPLSKGIFLVPFREPVQQAASMLRQHRRFSEIHREDAFVLRYMEAIGHHEFGEGLRPIDFGGWLDDAPSPERLEFWVRYWIAAYRHVVDHAGESTQLVCYADLASEPATALHAIADGVGIPSTALTSQSERVRPPRVHDVGDNAISARVREEAEALYEQLKREARV